MFSTVLFTDKSVSNFFKKTQKADLFVSLIFNNIELIKKNHFQPRKVIVSFADLQIYYLLHRESAVVNLER